MKRIIIAITLAACAGAPVKPLPAWYTAASADHPRFPRSRYITGVGLSQASAVDADLRAQANVSAQISAQLQSETSSFEQYSSRNGAHNESQDIASRTSVRSNFDRADLIVVVEREKQGGTFYSYAALDRRATDGEMSSEMAADLSSFKAAAEAAIKARHEADTGTFSSSVAEASRVRGKLDSSFVVRRAVAGRPAPEELAYMKLRNALLEMLAEAKARRVVGVVFKSGTSQLNTYTINAIKHLGLRPDNNSCSKREDVADATELVVDPSENCSEGSLGERCEVVVHLTAQGCAGGTAGEGMVPLVRGVHPSDRERARRSAWDKVTPAAVEAAVRDALKSTIQIGE